MSDPIRFDGAANIQGPVANNVQNVIYQVATHRSSSEPAFVVPYPSNPDFVGRADELQQLADLLAGKPPAIAGPGGQGKTQRATAYAHRQRSDYPGGIFWIPMEKEDRIPGQIATLAGPAGLDLPRMFLRQCIRHKRPCVVP